MTTSTPFTSLLVANRGEIALRIMRSARAAGLMCIGVHTDADADTPHVEFADRVVNIGPGPVADSYLSIERIIEAAIATGADAVHPGYGFLSERAEFAQACAEAGLVFVGPSPEAIALMGNKAVAKRQMAEAGVPCVPGYAGEDQSDATLFAEATRIGFPVMIKAAAGGGGRGMRRVLAQTDFTAALHLAQAEAMAGFGSSEIILEKAIARPRHVEIQIIADRDGSILHLGERDCSVQRRHQKVIEEAPGPSVTPELRQVMGAAAVRAARAIGYEGAGTVEFLLDEAGDFYFLEMNTRLQVEHPVTEMVTGFDLVAMQLAIAQGQPLAFAQEDVQIAGHAVEARLYAEDPAQGFLPSTGRVALWRPAEGEDIRVDEGITTGQEVTQHYDPMLAKIIARGATRDEARNRLIAALQDTVIFGVTTNRDFLIDILGDDTFAQGGATTAFIEEQSSPSDAEPKPAEVALAAALAYRGMQAEAVSQAVSAPDELQGWGSHGVLTSYIQLGDCKLEMKDSGTGTLEIDDGVKSTCVAGTGSAMTVNGQRVELRASLFTGDAIHVATSRACFSLPRMRRGAQTQQVRGNGSVVSPMHGKVLSVDVKVGDLVQPETRLAVLEAMKLQHEITSGARGIVSALYAVGGAQVSVGDLLIEIETEAET